MARGSPLRRRLAQLVLLLGSIGLALAAGEIGLRVLRPDQYRVWPPGLRAEFRPAPGVLPGVRGPSTFRINSEGMRAGEPPSGDVYRILAVGGSTTECLFLDQDLAWPHRLEVRLRAAGKPAFVGNVGKSGHGSRQNLLQLVHLLPQHPDVNAVVMLVGVNDLQAALQGNAPREGPFERSEYAQAFTVVPRAQALPESAPWYERTRIHGLLHPDSAPSPAATLQKELVQDPEGSFYASFRARRHAAPPAPAPPALEASLAAFRSTLDRAAAVAAERGVRLVLLTQPVLWRRDLPPELDALLWFGWGPASSFYYPVPALADAMDRYNQVTLDVCRARNIECVDVAALVPKDTTTFYDDCHFNENGARRVADILAEHLSSRPPLGAR